MADKEATVRIGIAGAEEALKALQDIRNALGDVGGEAKKQKSPLSEFGGNFTKGLKGAFGADGATKALGNAVGEIIKDIHRDIDAATVAAKRFSFADAVKETRQFDQDLSRLAIGSGKSFSVVDKRIAGIADATGQTRQSTAAWVKEIESLTGRYDYAFDSAQAFTDEAVATGRTSGELAPLEGSLFQLGVQGDKVKDALSGIRGVAQSLGTVGGPKKLQKDISDLTGVLSYFDVSSEKGQKKVAAFASEFGKGLSPAAQKRVQAQALGLISQNVTGVQYETGKKIYDEQGNVRPEAIGEYYNALKKHYGKASARRAFINAGGPQLALAVERAAEKGGAFDAVEGADKIAPVGVSKDAYAVTPLSQEDLIRKKEERTKLDEGRSRTKKRQVFDEFFAEHPYAAKADEYIPSVPGFGQAYSAGKHGGYHAANYLAGGRSEDGFNVISPEERAALKAEDKREHTPLPGLGGKDYDPTGIFPQYGAHRTPVPGSYKEIELTAEDIGRAVAAALRERPIEARLPPALPEGAAQ